MFLNVCFSQNVFLSNVGKVFDIYLWLILNYIGFSQKSYRTASHGIGHSKFLCGASRPKEHAQLLRDIVLQVHPKIVERIKWGNLIFVYNENNFASVCSFETISYHNLPFFKGALLPDPKRLLEGTGKGMRHLKIHSEKDINKKQIISWIKEAIKLNAKDKDWLDKLISLWMLSALVKRNGVEWLTFTLYSRASERKLAVLGNLVGLFEYKWD